MMTLLPSLKAISTGAAAKVRQGSKKIMANPTCTRRRRGSLSPLFTTLCVPRGLL